MPLGSTAVPAAEVVRDLNPGQVKAVLGELPGGDGAGLADASTATAALEAVDFGIALWNADGRLAWRNRRLAFILPELASHFQVGRRRIDIVRGLAASAAAPAQQLLPAVGSDGALISQEVAQEIALDDGREVAVSHRPAADGRIVSQYSDYAPWSRREAELQQIIAATLEASRSKTEFLANMSHELRTPLNAILGFADMMKNEVLGPVGTPKYREYVEDICASGNHLLGMINSILDLARIESGRVELSLEPVCLVQLVKEVKRLFAANATQAGIAIRVVAPDVVNAVQADRRAVRQILLNLMSNAVKFTPRGGAVTIGVSEGTNSISCIVADTGIGIPHTHLSRLGRPFEQVANALTRSHAGSGLGLAITKALVSMHGGELDIQSALGQGTTVTVTLPFDSPERSRAQIADAPASNA